MALTQIFPSGWEIVNSRFTVFGSNISGASERHTNIRRDSVNFYFDLPQKENH